MRCYGQRQSNASRLPQDAHTAADRQLARMLERIEAETAQLAEAQRNASQLDAELKRSISKLENVVEKGAQTLSNSAKADLARLDRTLALTLERIEVLTKQLTDDKRIAADVQQDHLTLLSYEDA